MPKVIMTVDDSMSIRQMVSLTLNEGGYEVIEAQDGVDAMNKLSGKSINLLITDLNMPNMDGINLIKKVRSDSVNKYIPILMLTTESQGDKKMEGKAAGATGWIVKPFKQDQLLAVVKKVLG